MKLLLLLIKASILVVIGSIVISAVFGGNSVLGSIVAFIYGLQVPRIIIAIDRLTAPKEIKKESEGEK